MNTSHHLWENLRALALENIHKDPFIAPLMQRYVLDQKGAESSLALILSDKLATVTIPAESLNRLFADGFATEKQWQEALTSDINAHLKNDPAIHDALTPWLYFKGFHALQTHRLAHHLWQRGRRQTALFLQNRCAEVFGVDIHPAATIGKGIMMDHATGIVIGETAVVEDDVLFWHNVTLGGKGTTEGARHPIVRRGARLGAHSTIIGHIEVGEFAVIAAGSVVVKTVPGLALVAGQAAEVLKKKS